MPSSSVTKSMFSWKFLLAYSMSNHTELSQPSLEPGRTSLGGGWEGFPQDGNAKYLMIGKPVETMFGEALTELTAWLSFTWNWLRKTVSVVWPPYLMVF